jgi:hypothetical protein
MNSTISTPLLSQKTITISFLEDICLNVFVLLGEYGCIQCFYCSFVSTFTNETQVLSPVTRSMWLRNSLPSSWYFSEYFGLKPKRVNQMNFRSTRVLVRQKRIAARISQLAGLSIAGHIITQSIETRTSTRWPVTQWFARQWVMWRYLACASFPFLLYWLPKKNEVYSPNSPVFNSPRRGVADPVPERLQLWRHFYCTNSQ